MVEIKFNREILNDVVWTLKRGGHPQGRKTDLDYFMDTLIYRQSGVGGPVSIRERTYRRN